jgi:hypothetical protein
MVRYNRVYSLADGRPYFIWECRVLRYDAAAGTYEVLNVYSQPLYVRAH